jgi:predicted PurR-regulated permease PerM
VSTTSAQESRPSTSGSASARIIAGGIVIAFCYWASSVLVTLLVAVLLAYFLDPVVSWMEDWHIPRALGSLLIVFVTVGLLFSLTWALVVRLDQFGSDWPKYRAPLRAVASTIEKRLEGLEKHVSEISAEENNSPRQVFQVNEPHSVRNAVLSHLGSLYTAILASTFVPFLVFFMLAAKRQVWHATMQLFPASERTQVKLTLDEVSVMLRSYVIGTGLVGVILILASWIFFWSIGLDFPFLAALASGLLNLVPYLGVVMSWVPPLIVGLRTHHTGLFYVGIIGMLSFFHLMGANVLFPALVGRRVHLNAVAVTISLLFWGFMWGALGLLLAIPITATIKVICDHIESCQPVGRWLGA